MTTKTITKRKHRSKDYTAPVRSVGRTATTVATVGLATGAIGAARAAI